MIPIVAQAQPSVLPALSVAAVPLGDAFLAMMVAIEGEQPVAALAGQVDVPVVIDDEIPQADDPVVLPAQTGIVLPFAAPLPLAASAPLPSAQHVTPPLSQLPSATKVAALMTVPGLMPEVPSGSLAPAPQQAEPDRATDLAPTLRRVAAMPASAFPDLPPRPVLLPASSIAATSEPPGVPLPEEGDGPAKWTISDHRSLVLPPNVPLALPDLLVPQALIGKEPAGREVPTTITPTTPTIPAKAQRPSPQPIAISAHDAMPTVPATQRNMWAPLLNPVVKGPADQSGVPRAWGPEPVIAAAQLPLVQPAPSSRGEAAIVKSATIAPTQQPADQTATRLLPRAVVPKEPRPSTAESAFTARAISGHKNVVQNLPLPPEQPVLAVSEPEISPDEMPLPTAADADIPLLQGTDPGIANAPVPVQTPHHATPRAVITTDPVSIANLPQTFVTLAKHDEKQGVALRLDPVELGAIQVTMRGDDKDMTIIVIVDRPETRDLLRKHADQFIADLRQSGITSPTISFDLAGQQGFAHRTPPRQDVLPDLVPDSFVSAPPTPKTPPHIMQSGALDLRL